MDITALAEAAAYDADAPAWARDPEHSIFWEAMSVALSDPRAAEFRELRGTIRGAA